MELFINPAGFYIKKEKKKKKKGNFAGFLYCGYIQQL